MEGFNSLVEGYRLQGRLRQLRDQENMLGAVKEWIVTYEKEQLMENLKMKQKGQKYGTA